MSRHNLGEKNMNNKYIKEIRKALTEIVGLNKLGYDFKIKKGKNEDTGWLHPHIFEPIWVDGFWVNIDYDFWNDEKEKRETFNHLLRYFPAIQYCDDDQLAFIPLSLDNFGGINA